LCARPARATLPRTRGGAAPAFPRRVSGPVGRPIRGGGAVALPAPRTRAGSRIGPLLDRLARSRALIWIVGLSLMGVVAMQVSLLKMNAGISRAVQSATTLERQNAGLEASIARLGSQERVRAEALKLGMLSPSAGSVGYVTARPGIDAARAARRIQPPSAEAVAIMQAGAATAALTAAPGTTTAAAATTTAPATAQTQAPVVQQAQAPVVGPEQVATGAGIAPGQG
jgi:cell division protein FtsL